MDEEEDPLFVWECAYPGRCLCPHPDHQAWECYTVEDAEDREFEEEAERAQAEE